MFCTQDVVNCVVCINCSKSIATISKQTIAYNAKYNVLTVTV